MYIYLYELSLNDHAPKTTREKENWKNIFHFFRTDLRLLPGCTIFGGGTELACKAWSTLNPLPGEVIVTFGSCPKIMLEFSIHFVDENSSTEILNLLRNIGKNRARFWKIKNLKFM